jgi:hypothetical protein
MRPPNKKTTFSSCEGICLYYYYSEMMVAMKETKVVACGRITKEKEMEFILKEKLCICNRRK